MKRVLSVAGKLATAVILGLILLLVATTGHRLWIERGTGLPAKYWRYSSWWDARKPLETGGFWPDKGSTLAYPDLYHVWSLYQRSTLEFRSERVSGMAVEVFGARTRTHYRFDVPEDVAASLKPGVHTLSLDTDRDSLGIMFDGRIVREVPSTDDYLEGLVFLLGDGQLELLSFRVVNTAVGTLSEQVDFRPRRLRVLGILPVCGAIILVAFLFLLLDVAIIAKVTARPWSRAAARLGLHYLPLLLGLAIWRKHIDQRIIPLTALAISLFLRSRHAILARGLFSVRERAASAAEVWLRRISARGMARWSVIALLAGAATARVAIPYAFGQPEVLASWAGLAWALLLAYGTLVAALGRISGPETARRLLWTFAPIAMVLPWMFLPRPVPRIIVGPVLLCTMLFQFTFLSANRTKVRGYGLLMTAWILLLLAGLELWMRGDPQLRRWAKPMGLGETYVPDDALFYVPKSLFVRREDFPMRDDFKVVSDVNFRSGVIPRKKPPGTFRIIVLGGSNVWGDGIDDVKDVFTEVLERRLNSRGAGATFEVVNAGVRGYNSFQLMILDREYLSQYEADLGILYLNRNDLIHDEGPYTYRELYRMMHDERGSSWVPEVQGLLRRSFVYNYYTDLVVRGRLWMVSRYSPSERVSKNVNPPEDYAQNLRDLIEQFRGRGAKVLLAAEYWGEAAARNMDLKGDIPEQRALMAEVGREEGVPFVDVYGILRERYNVADIVFSHDLVHCNKAGHEAIAEALEEALIKDGLVPIPPQPTGTHLN